MRIPLLPDYVFGKPWMLLLLLLIPLLLLMRGHIGRAPAVVFSSLSFLRAVAKPVRSRFSVPFAAIITMLALASGVLALARPQKVKSKEHNTASGIEIFIAIDVSYSMSIRDFRLDGYQVNRLDAAKHVISEFIDGRPTDRIGLVIFSGRPHALGPLTLDHEWLDDTIENEVHFKHDIDGGTAIGKAITSCAESLAGRDAKRKAKSQIVVLLTDGDQTVTSVEPPEAARIAATLGIKVYPIAIGTPGRHTVPLMGRDMIQSFDLETLKKVAEVSNGKAYEANDTETLRQIFAEIDQLEKSDIDQLTTVEKREFYQLFAAVAVALFFVSLALEHSLFNHAP